MSTSQEKLKISTKQSTEQFPIFKSFGKIYLCTSLLINLLIFLNLIDKKQNMENMETIPNLFTYIFNHYTINTSCKSIYFRHVLVF